ncbi:MAG: DUF3822 family protein [Muribaculaceae bacterium]|nr:DUF3822 family protein [Muribaculaceae bacterium]
MEGKERISIQHPEAWELLVSIDSRRVNYILFTPAVAGSLITGAVKVTDDTLQSLEDAVYDTPELLNEYKRVRVVIHSPHFVLLPADTADDDCMALVREAFPDDDGDMAVCELPLNGVKIAYLMPRGMQAFLGRTFNYPVTVHHLMPLCEHFKELNRGDDISRMFLHLSSAHMDVAVYRDGALQMVNTYPFTNAQDAAYFALNAWRTHDLDQLTDELQLTGDGDTRAIMTPVLREYVKYVMPAVYPAAAMRLGRNAMQAPLELILLALCE